ncbi:MAG: DMT family transporter [Pseudomonadota bacterium]
MTLIELLSPQTRRHARFLVVASTLFWSLTGITLHFIAEANNWQIVFYRSLGLLVFMLLITDRRHVLAKMMETGSAGLIGGMSLGICFVALIYSMTHSTVANALFLMSVYPVFATVLAALCLGEIITRRTSIAALVAMAGVGLMFLHGWRAGTLFGSVMGLTCALGYAVFSVCIRWGKLKDMMPSMIYAAVFVLIVAGGIMSAGNGFAISLHDFILCFMLGFVAIGVGFYLYTASSKLLETSELTLLSLLEVLFAVLWVWIFADETPNAWTMAGGLLVIGAIVYRSREQMAPV